MELLKGTGNTEAVLLHESKDLPSASSSEQRGWKQTAEKFNRLAEPIYVSLHKVLTLNILIIHQILVIQKGGFEKHSLDILSIVLKERVSVNQIVSSSCGEGTLSLYKAIIRRNNLIYSHWKRDALRSPNFSFKLNSPCFC